MPGRQLHAQIPPPLAVLGVLTMALSGCAQGNSSPDAQATSTTVVTKDIVFDPAGGASGNRDWFQKVLTEVAHENVTERELRSAVERSGFEGWPMESTQDMTTLEGVEADVHQIAVLGPDGACLVGQVGPGVEVTAVVTKPIQATGKCLIGLP